METILIVTDAWHPQVNGVVRTLEKLISILNEKYNVIIINPNTFDKQYSAPFYKEIQLAFPKQNIVEKLIDIHKPNYIHISTEGPIGLAFKRYCVKNNLKFTTSYHTKFPEFLWNIAKVPTWMTRWYFRWFHSKSSGMFVATKSMAKELSDQGFKNIVMWSRGVGVDKKVFKPRKRIFGKIVFVYVGRVSKEKNLDAFLSLDLPGLKIVVGDGPDLKRLMKKYSDAKFVGYKTGKELSEYYSLADVFVFPSKSDTFGMVMLEAMACGTPIAAYPVTGPIDIVTEKTGVLSNDLKQAALDCLKLKRKDCVKEANKYTWKNTAKLFTKSLVKINEL